MIFGLPPWHLIPGGFSYRTLGRKPAWPGWKRERSISVGGAYPAVRCLRAPVFDFDRQALFRRKTGTGAGGACARIGARRSCGAFSTAAPVSRAARDRSVKCLPRSAEKHSDDFGSGVTTASRGGWKAFPPLTDGGASIQAGKRTAAFPPQQRIGCSFTSKAAAEMREPQPDLLPAARSQEEHRSVWGGRAADRIGGGKETPRRLKCGFHKSYAAGAQRGARCTLHANRRKRGCYRCGKRRTRRPAWTRTLQQRRGNGIPIKESVSVGNAGRKI